MRDSPKRYQINSSTDWGKYFYAFYWVWCTITTVGFGDISSADKIELACNSVMIVTGDVIYVKQIK